MKLDRSRMPLVSRPVSDMARASYALFDAARSSSALRFYFSGYAFIVPPWAI